MALGDGIRRNVAHVSQEERDRLIRAIVRLDSSKFYIDGVSHWDKQDQIHQATHNHTGPSFLPWHRELCNQFEGLIRAVDNDLSLHYWDWTTDPRASPDGKGGTVDLFSETFMGSSNGRVGPPFDSFDNAREEEGSRGKTGKPADPPQELKRSVLAGLPEDHPIQVKKFKSDAEMITTGDLLPQEQQWHAFSEALEQMHGTDEEEIGGGIHSYIGGNIGNPHTAFQDPFVFLLHSNVDRLFAMWQMAPGKAWRLDPRLVYGNESFTTGKKGITTRMEPWAGESDMTPWKLPAFPPFTKDCKHPSVVKPPLYDTLFYWRWTNLGMPKRGTNVAGPVGVLTSRTTPASAQRPYAFVRGSDENLWVCWWNGSAWAWVPLDRPQGADSIRPVGVLTVKDTPTSVERPYVFVRDHDAGLWINHWNGSAWGWTPQSTPHRSIRPVGVVTVMDTPAFAQRPYAFVIANEKDLWVHYWDGSAWIWNQRSKPDGFSSLRPVGVLTVKDTPGSAQRPYVFVIDDEKELWVHFWNGSAWAWAPQGGPQEETTIRPVGVLTVKDTPASAERPYVFVLDTQDNLWVHYWDGSKWIWSKHGKPEEVSAIHPVGVLTVMDTPLSAQRPYLFVRDDDGNLWVYWWNNSDWEWVNQGKPPEVDTINPVGALTVMDTQASAQRPYVFMRGSDGNLWVNWWA